MQPITPDAQRELDEAIAALSAPGAGAEVMQYLRDMTAEANREHERVLNRSWQLGHPGVPFLPSYRSGEESHGA